MPEILTAPPEVEQEWERALDAWAEEYERELRAHLEQQKPMQEAADAHGREHAPAGSSEGGQFVSQGAGSGGGGGTAEGSGTPTSTKPLAYRAGDRQADGYTVPVNIEKGPGDSLVYWGLRGSSIPAHHYEGLGNIGFHEASWIPGRTASGLTESAGTYQPDTKAIQLAVNAPGGGNVKVFGGGTVIHEVGHHVHLAKMTDAAVTEWNAISEKGQRARISAYARTNQGEHFAEAYRAYHHQSDRARLKNLEPKAYAFMAKLSRKDSSALLPAGTLAPLSGWRKRYDG